MLIIIIELLVVLLALYLGSKYGSLALGAIAGLGLAILVFDHGLKPGTPPTDVIYIIVAAVTCAGILQASGGMDWMIQIVERLLRKHPGRITILSALNGFNISILQIISVTIPACLCGIIVAASWSYQRGLDLDKDPEFQEKLKDPVQYAFIYGKTETTLNKTIDKKAKWSVYIFLAAILLIVLLSVFHHILPAYDTVVAIDGAKPVMLSTGKTVTPENLAAAGIIMPGVTQKIPVTIHMYLVIQIILISTAALIIMICGAKPKTAVANNVWQSGMVAVVAIYGIAWLANTFFGAHMTEVEMLLDEMVENYPWAIAFVFFFFSVLINSQAAVIVALLPVAYKLGIPGWILLGALPCVYGYFFIPNYPSDIATVNIDRTGTTKIGKYVLNHSFMIPGLICVSVSTVVAYLISSVFF